MLDGTGWGTEDSGLEGNTEDRKQELAEASEEDRQTGLEGREGLGKRGLTSSIKSPETSNSSPSVVGM